MSSRIEDVIGLCCQLSKNQQISVAVKNSAKGAAVAGAGAFAGGIIGGPVGIAVGATLGGMLGSWMTSGQFKPLPEILIELPETEKQKLYNEVMAVIGSFSWVDFAELMALVVGNYAIQQQVVAALLNYVTHELRAEVKYEN